MSVIQYEDLDVPLEDRTILRINNEIDLTIIKYDDGYIFDVYKTAYTDEDDDNGLLTTTYVFDTDLFKKGGNSGE